MAERRDDWNAGANYDETRDPANPPNSVLNQRARNAAFWSSFGPLIVLTIVVGLGLVYWSARGPAAPDRPERQQAVGTSGDTTPGGFEPEGRPDSTRDELERRGGVDDPAQGAAGRLHDKTPLTSVSDVTGKTNDAAGRPVDLKDVEVDSAQGNSFWVRDGDDKVEVTGDGQSLPRKGAHVHVIGTAEAAGDRILIRASKIEAR